LSIFEINDLNDQSAIKKNDMTETIEDLTNEERQERYRNRVNAFFKQVEQCIPDELEINLNAIPHFTITDATGTYPVNMAVIYKKEVPEPDNLIVNIFPIGATTLLGEGILELSGPFGEEKLIYFSRETLPKVEYKPGSFRPIYRSVDLDGWYWLESSISNRAILVDCQQLFDLIRMVSAYACD
jgi:hypothetical protein